MNPVIFNNLINRLIISPFVENVNANNDEQSASFDIKIPLFATRPKVPKLFEQYIGASIGSYGTDHVIRYWHSYAAMMLMPYTSLVKLTCEYDKKEKPTRIHFSMKLV